MRFSLSVYAAMAMIGSALAAVPVQATILEPFETFEVVPIEFTGVVTSSGSDNLQIIDENGKFVPYTGPAPDYPLQTGETFTIGFDALVPSGEAIADGFVPESADGIYRFEIGPPTPNDNFREFAAVTNVSGTGGIGPAPDAPEQSSAPSGGGLVIIYDAVADTYSLGSTSVSGFNFSLTNLDGPLLRYNSDTNTMLSGLYSEFLTNNPFLGLTGTSPTQASFLSGVVQPGTRRGGYLFDVDIEGAFNLPIFGSDDPTPVPAPPMMILFGLAAAAVFGRGKIRLKRAQSA